MSFKTTYVLFGVLIGMLALLGLTLALKKPNTDTGAVFPSFAEKEEAASAQDINTVEIALQDKDKLVFVRDARGWRLITPGLRVDPFAIQSIIRQVTEAHREEDTDVTNNAERWGLTHPAAVVTLKKGTREWTLKLGSQSPEENGVVYVSSSDRAGEVLAVRRASIDSVVSFKLDRVWSRDLLQAGEFETREVTIEGPAPDGQTQKKLTLRLKRPGFYAFVTPAFGPAEMEAGMYDVGAKRESPGVRGLLLAINALKADGLEEFEKHSLRWYGLQDGARVLRITVKNIPRGRDATGATTETLLVTGKLEKKTGKAEKQYYARLASGTAVFRVSAKGLETIEALLPEEGERLRSLQVMQVRPTEPDAIDIHSPRGDVQLRRTGASEWKLRSDATGVQKADLVRIQQLLAELSTNHQVKGFGPSGKNEVADKTWGLSAPVTTIAIWVGGLAPQAEKGDKKNKKKGKDDRETKNEGAFPKTQGMPTLTLAFGSMDGKAYVRRDVGGDISRVEVAAGLLKRVQANPIIYLDRMLSLFAVPQAVGLVRIHQGVKLEIARDEKSRAWKLVQPLRPNDRAGVDVDRLTALLGRLAQISVEQWIKARPGDDDLKTYKLVEPRLKIEIKVQGPDKKKPQTVTLAFGGKTTVDNREGVYCLARLPGKDTPAVFLVAPGLVQAIATDEVRDRNVLHFEAAHVERIAIKGWDDIKKKTKELELSLKRAGDKPWQIVMSSTAALKLSQQRVQALVTKLADLKMERLVDAELAKADDLNDKRNQLLSIAITLKDKKGVLMLVIGKRAGTEPLRYAASSTLPREVFLLAPQDLAGLTASIPWIDYFKKPDLPKE